MRSPALLAALIALAAATAPVTTAAGPAPVVKLQTRPFGTVLATRGHKALYWWTTEKRAGYTIRCTGSCAELWPPVIVAARAEGGARRPRLHRPVGTIRPPGRPAA